MSENTFSCQIHNHLAVLSRNEQTGWCKELNRVSFNGGRPRYDIREWNPSHKKMSRGITLTEAEMDVIRGLFEHGHL